MFDAIREIVHCKSLLLLDNVRGAEETVQTVEAPRDDGLMLNYIRKLV